jgi:transketolase
VKASVALGCTQARLTMRPWIFNQWAEAYAMSADWDNRWRTGGTVDEVLEEAHLSPAWILAGIQRFVADKARRMEAIRQAGRGITSTRSEAW